MVGQILASLVVRNLKVKSPRARGAEHMLSELARLDWYYF